MKNYLTVLALFAALTVFAALNIAADRQIDRLQERIDSLQAQIEALKEDYSAGVPLMEMADRHSRDYREVAIMLMELAHYGRLEPRDNGVF